MNKHGHSTFNMRIDKDLLVFMKQAAIRHDCTMTALVSKILTEFKKKCEKKNPSLNNDE